MDREALGRLALQARKNAYAPYSHFTVGAALLGADGKIYTGCNIENAGFSATVCAERAAFFQGISQGQRQFLAIAIAGARENQEPLIPCPPCGVCRQVMAEFCDPETFEILLVTCSGVEKSYFLKELLPLGFSGNSLG